MPFISVMAEITEMTGESSGERHRQEKIADLGLQIDVVGRTLETLLGGRQVTRFGGDQLGRVACGGCQHGENGGGKGFRVLHGSPGAVDGGVPLGFEKLYASYGCGAREKSVDFSDTRSCIIRLKQVSSWIATANIPMNSR